MGIQFEAVERLRNPHLGLLWDRYRKEFPKLEERHSRPPVSESFEAAPAGQRQVRLQMLDRPDVSLVWFVSEEGNELIQVQRDRFVFNWRRQPGDMEYPRYGYVRKRFLETFDVFQRFLVDQGLGHVAPNQSEVSYVNQILSNGTWHGLDEIGNVIPSWRPRYTESFLPALEDFRLAVSYQMPDPEGRPKGRLRITTAPGRPENGRQTLVLQLTARGRPSDPTIESALDFLDTGREWIVRGFTAFTSPTAHLEWERRNGD